MVLSKDELMRRVWPGRIVEENSPGLVVCVSLSTWDFNPESTGKPVDSPRSRYHDTLLVSGGCGRSPYRGTHIMLTRGQIFFAVLSLAISMTLPPTAWSAKLEGDYQGTGNSFFEKLSFRSGGKVRVTFAGMTKVGTFEIDGNEVLVTIANETNVFTIDAEGCVVGGGLLGKYCKGGSASKDGDEAATSGGGDKQGAAPSGGETAGLSGIYKAGDGNMNIALDFKPNQKVRVTVAGKKAKKESVDATYKIAGNRVTISVPDGSPPLVLVRSGNTLEGAPEGETMKMKFVKQ
jgi:hypothetical protein